jgi:hypothetical protein
MSISLPIQFPDVTVRIARLETALASELQRGVVEEGNEMKPPKYGDA